MYYYMFDKSLQIKSVMCVSQLPNQVQKNSELLAY